MLGGVAGAECGFVIDLRRSGTGPRKNHARGTSAQMKQKIFQDELRTKFLPFSKDPGTYGSCELVLSIGPKKNAMTHDL